MNQQYVPNCPFQVIKLVTGEQAFIDSEDFELVASYDWYLSGKRYAATGHEGLRMHHLILGLSNFDTHEVHHNNENELDNRKSNLKTLSFSEHLTTRPLQSNNKTGFKGVSWKNSTNNRRSAFIAQISFQGRKMHLGRFKTSEDAAHEYDRMAKELYGDIAYLNFPNDTSS